MGVDAIANPPWCRTSSMRRSPTDKSHDPRHVRDGNASTAPPPFLHRTARSHADRGTLKPVSARGGPPSKECALVAKIIYEQTLPQDRTSLSASPSKALKPPFQIPRGFTLYPDDSLIDL
ncbi:MAG: hypothetical protein KF866_08485 [Phycisphaeraceae bacterium]|nr:hypothetical protein [Phycisphaeraceae bacterium]